MEGAVSSTKLARLYFRMAFCAVVVLVCLSVMIALAVLGRDPLNALPAFSGIVGYILGMWQNEIDSRKRIGIALPPNRPPEIIDMSSGTPPPSPASGYGHAELPPV